MKDRECLTCEKVIDCPGKREGVKECLFYKPRKKEK